jgi:ribosomal-protein-alanine N-acetyltransferase
VLLFRCGSSWLCLFTFERAVCEWLGSRRLRRQVLRRFELRLDFSGRRCIAISVGWDNYRWVMAAFLLMGERIGIRRPGEGDCDEFVAMVQASRELHRPWVDPPGTRERFLKYLESRLSAADDGFLICKVDTGEIAGVVNLNCIVRGHFHSAFLGYYINAAFARRWFMTEGVQLVAKYAFTEMGLHRLEANIQPENAASLAVARKCGFRKEGFSPRYLKVNGEWRDHERWALLADEFAALSTARTK